MFQHLWSLTGVLGDTLYKGMVISSPFGPKSTRSLLSGVYLIFRSGFLPFSSFSIAQPQLRCPHHQVRMYLACSVVNSYEYLFSNYTCRR